MPSVEQIPDSIYEAFRTYAGVVALAPEHQARWERSLRAIGYEGVIPDLCVEAAHEIAQADATHDVKVKVVFDPSDGITTESWLVPRYTHSFFWDRPWKVKTVVGMRVHPELKNTFTEFVTSERALASEEGYDEILMIDEEGQVREGGWTNVFFEKSGVLITPARGVLPGIARQTVLDAAARLEIPVEVRDVSADELSGMDAYFLTSSVRGMVPTGPITPMMRRLAGWCASLIDRRISPPLDTQFMGVVNVTPDSFSDGGRFVDQGGTELVLEAVNQMVESGATVIDVGGESTGPGSVDVTLEEELSRVLPVVKAIRAAHPDVEISIDTWKSEVAEAAVAAGATMINDVTAGRGDARIAAVAARTGVPLVLMYSKDAGPRTTRESVEYEDVMATIKTFLSERIEWARAQGVERIIVDPGMGAFVSANPKYSFEIMDRLEELRTLRCPILVGTSRKSCLGEDRLGGTLATTLWLRGRADFLRVHDVLENVTVSS